MTIKKKLIGAFLFLIILPSLCLQVWSYWVINDIMLEHICQAELHALNSAVKETQNVFTEMNRILTWLSTDTRVRLLMQTEIDRGEHRDTLFDYEQLKASEQILDQSQMLLMKYPFDILLVPVSGTAYGNCENIPLVTEHIRSSEWFEEILSTPGHKIRWLEPGLDRPGRNYVFTAAVPVHGPVHQKENVGIAYIGISEEYVCKTYAGVNPYGNTYLTDRERRIVSSQQKKLIDQPVTVLTDGESSLSSGEGWERTSVNGERTFALHSERISDNWRFLTLIPGKVILGRLYSTQKRLMLFNLGIVSTAVLVAVALAGVLSKPLVRLSATARLVEEGNLDVCVPETSTGEIGLLEQNFNRMINRVKEMMEEMRLQERRRTQAEIDALQAQINPHFLFNVLSAIRWASKEERVERMVIALCTLLKASMRRGGNIISIREECTLLHQYVELNNLRYRGTVQFFDEIQEEMREIRIPRFLLQPLIENSIIHGFEHCEGNGIIRLTGEFGSPVMLLRVIDDGCGFPPEFKLGDAPANAPRHSSSLSSIALKNVAERLTLYYGCQASLECTNVYDREGIVAGACVTLSIPYGDAEADIEHDHLLP